ncbi:hypothetical protein M3Y97_00107500 [Aphelenchoides bicaudatus]|nr:hypothetical protein M3Y97_00107500 [Aphelenchoides bicaudatus]
MNSLLSVVWLCCLIQVGFACKCAVPTQKDVWERSDVVARMKIVSKKNEGHNIKYMANYVESYKPAGQFHIAVPVPITTASVSAACGVTNLEVNNEYLITATRDGKELHINTCNGMPGKEGSSSQPLGALHSKHIGKELEAKLKSGKF